MFKNRFGATDMFVLITGTYITWLWQHTEVNSVKVNNYFIWTLSLCGPRWQCSSAQTCSIKTTRWPIKDWSYCLRASKDQPFVLDVHYFALVECHWLCMWGEEAEMWRPWIPKLVWEYSWQIPSSAGCKKVVCELFWRAVMSFRALSKVGNTSGCQMRLAQRMERLVVTVKHMYLMQLKISEIIVCIYLFVHK